ncbi:MAG: glycosyltransferase [Planctomycetota bacterium]
MTIEFHPPHRVCLSVAMIVRDEEDVLATTLESVRAIADEILVLDTGSTDQTAGVAQRLGASVSRTRWNGDFSAARNRLLGEATGDWILWLDAGERLSPESAGALRDFLDHEADRSNVYLMLVETPPADPSASAEQMAQPRLMPSHPDLRFAGRVCETLRPSLEAAGLSIDAAPGRIVRHQRVHNRDRKARNAQRDLTLIALEASQSDGPSPRLLVALGKASSDLDDRPAARRAFLQAVRHAPRGSTEMLEAYYGLLSTYDGEEHARDSQVALCLEALEIYPLDAQLLCATGGHLQAQNQLDMAARAFETAVSYGTVDPRTWHVAEIDEMAAAFLALTLEIQGKDDDARRVLEEALARLEHSVRIRRHLLDLDVKHGRTEDAVRAADALPLDSQQREPLQDAIRGACEAARKNWLPALALLQSAYLAGCRQPFCLKWLTVTLLSNGQAEAAEPVLHEWLQLAPGNVEVQAYVRAIQQDLAERESSGALSPVESEPSRWIRVDEATTVMDAMPSRMPIIHQAFSTDVISDPSD